MEFVIGKYSYWICIVLMMTGIYAVIAKRNLMKKIVGLSILQTSIILYFISAAAKRGATVPVIHLMPGEIYVNPLPHVLMLTSIVVMVATAGVAFALIITIYKRYGTLEEDEILKIMRDER